MTAVLLVFIVLLSSVLSSPLHNQPLHGGERKQTEDTIGHELKYNHAVGQATPASRSEELKDLTAQESFYPVGGFWWGIRPWGGWGGWGSWGGYRPWHGPQWGGHWGGGHWGSGRWGRSS